MHREKRSFGLPLEVGDTLVVNRILVKAITGPFCELCCFYEKKECGMAPPCADTLFQPVPADTDLYLTLRLRGEI